MIILKAVINTIEQGPYHPILMASDKKMSKDIKGYLTFTRRNATNPPGPVEDIVCFLKGEPLAFMVLTKGKFQSNTVHYDGAIHHARTVSFNEKMERVDWIKAHEDEIRQGCLKLI